MNTSKCLSDYELRYSRQILAIGEEFNLKLKRFDVFIYGLRAVGSEIAKNLAVMGVKKLHIFDPKITMMTDLSYNPLLAQSQIGKLRRDFAILNSIKEINPEVVVEVAEFDPLKDLTQLRAFHIVIFTEVLNIDFLNSVSDFLKDNKRCFIYAATTGLSGFIFSDFGKEYLIRDADESECRQHSIKKVSKSEPGIVTIDDSKLTFMEGDFVVFKEIQGMIELNESPPRPIKVIGSHEFTIEDTSKYSDFTSGGIVERVKVPNPVSYKSFKEYITNPFIEGRECKHFDNSKVGRKELLHIIYSALHIIVKTPGQIPMISDDANLSEYLDLVKKHFVKYKNESPLWMNNCEEFNEELAKSILLSFNHQTAPISNLVAGLVSNEVIKYTGKYLAINQLVYFDFYETIDPIAGPPNLNQLSQNNRSFDFISVYGNDLFQKIKNLSITVIGAGSIGNEVSKQLALMGFSSDQGKITIIDDSLISYCDLSKSFSFRTQDLMKSKLEKVSQMINSVSGGMQLQLFQTKMNEETQDIFGDSFWNKQDFIISCVNDIESRKYIDKRCVWFNKPFIDLGLSGLKGHMQFILPGITNTYGDLEDQTQGVVTDIQLNDELFPFTFQHCLSFANASFYKFYIQDINDFIEFQANPKQFFKEIKELQSPTFVKEKTIRLSWLSSIVNTSSKFNYCIEYAYDLFNYYFNNRIKHLLSSIPPDFMNDEDIKFWGGRRRLPSPYVFRSDDDLCFSFVDSFLQNLCLIFNIKKESPQYIKSYLDKIKPQTFTLQKNLYKINEDSENGGYTADECYVLLNEDEKIIEGMQSTLLGVGSSINPCNKLKACEFDLDNNFHQLELIYSWACIQAKCYKIKEWGRLRSKFYSGNQVPSVISTASALAGYACLQLLGFIQGRGTEDLRDTYLDFGSNNYVLSEPGAKIIKSFYSSNNDCENTNGISKIDSKSWTIWDKIEINSKLTIKQLIDYLNTMFQVEENSYVFSEFVIEGKTLLLTEENLSKDVSFFKSKSNYENYIIIQAFCKNKSEDFEHRIDLPLIRYLT